MESKTKPHKVRLLWTEIEVPKSTHAEDNRLYTWSKFLLYTIISLKLKKLKERFFNYILLFNFDKLSVHTLNKLPQNESTLTFFCVCVCVNSNKISLGSGNWFANWRLLHLF